MELRQLRYFVEVAETEHLTQSAKALFVTQSTLSHGLRQLEQELGVHLFDRVGRGLKISQAGLIFKGYVGRALQEVEAGRMALTRLNDLQVGTLTVGVIPTFLNSLVPAAVASFSGLYPGIKVAIRDLRAELIEDLLINGQLDVGIAFHPAEREEIDTEQLQLLVSANHRLARRRTLPIALLDGVPLCLLPRSFATRRMLDASFKTAGMKPLVRVEMESVGALIAACETGQLSTIVPERAARVNGHMHAITLTDPQLTRHAGILWRKGASRSVAAQAFVGLLRPETSNQSDGKLKK